MTDRTSDLDNARDLALLGQITPQLTAPFWSQDMLSSRITAVIDGMHIPMVVREDGSAAVNPTSEEGPVNWVAQYHGATVFNENIAPYYPLGQIVYHLNRQYSMTRTYTVPPTPFTDENWRDIFADAMTGNEPIDPTIVDAAVTDKFFTRVDASTYVYVTQEDTSAGAQTWQRTTAVGGSSGGGLAQVVGDEDGPSERAHAVLSGFGAAPYDRKVWLRVMPLEVGDQVSACSHGTGSLGTVTTTSLEYHWLLLSEVAKANDASFHLIGRDDGMVVDAFILTTVDNVDIPTGVDGFQPNEAVDAPQPTPTVTEFAMVSPVDGDTFANESATFTWTAGDDTATQWYLRVGNSVNGVEYEDTRFTNPATLTHTVSGIPTDGRTIFVTLSIKHTDGSWENVYYQYSAYAEPASTVPEISTPAVGSTLLDSFSAITWVDNGFAATDYTVRLGTTPGGDDILEGTLLGPDARSVSVPTVPKNGRTIYMEFVYKTPGGDWIERSYTYKAYTTPGTPGVWASNIIVPPTITNPYIIEVGHGENLQTIFDNEYDVTGRHQIYNVPDGRSAIIRMKPGSGPLGYPIKVFGGIHHIFEGIEMVTITQPGCAIGQSRNNKHNPFTPNVNPRVPTSKMIQSECTGVTIVHGANADLTGHETDFLVPRNPSSQSFADARANRECYVVNSRVVGYMSLDKVPNNEGVIMDGAHGDLIQNQGEPLGKTGVENVTVYHQGNGITHHVYDKTRLTQFIVNNINWGRDARYFSRPRSNGLPYVVHTDSFSVQNMFIESNNNAPYGRVHHNNVGAGNITTVKEISASSAAGYGATVFNGSPPGGDIATADKTGFNYVSPF